MGFDYKRLHWADVPAPVKDMGEKAPPPLLPAGAKAEAEAPIGRIAAGAPAAMARESERIY
jgi:hypothetical protein